MKWLCAWALYEGAPVVFTRPAEGKPAHDARLQNIREVEAHDADEAARVYARLLVDEGIMAVAIEFPKDEPS